jgi:hypothetical protein
VRLGRERGKLGLWQTRILDPQLDGKTEPAALARLTSAVTFVLLASFFCCLATKSIAPPKQAA